MIGSHYAYRSNISSFVDWIWRISNAKLFAGSRYRGFSKVESPKRLALLARSLSERKHRQPKCSNPIWGFETLSLANTDCGRGHGSPIVVGQQVILPTADEKNQVQSIVAIDRRSGKQLWSTELSREGFPKKNHPKNTEATPTVASDGESLYACFFHHKAIHLYKLSLDGKVSYQQNLGEFDPKQFEYGYAPSPCLYKNQVIVCAEYDGKSYLVSLQSRDGKELWRTARPSSISFSTPVVASVAGRDQLLLSGNQKVSSYDPMTGKELWAVDGTTFATCGTMIWEGNTVFASGGFPKAETIAVQADGSGKILWRNDQKCYEQSMIVHQGYVYALTDKGVLYCWQASDGKEMWKQRLQGPVSSSPVLVDNRIYWANESGTMYVFEANPQKYVSLSENKIGDESFASPAVCGNQFFVRTAVGQGPSDKSISSVTPRLNPRPHRIGMKSSPHVCNLTSFDQFVARLACRG